MFIRGIDSEGREILVNTAYIVTLEAPDDDDKKHKDKYYHVRLLYRDGFNLNSIYVKKESMDAYIGIDTHKLIKSKLLNEIYSHKKED